MPKYINSKFLSGADFVVRDNGRIFKRTGSFVKRSTAEAARSKHQPSKSLVIRQHEIEQVLYNATCSGAALGEQAIAPGGTLELNTDNTDVQMRFTGTSPGDTGTLVLSTGPGDTCTVTLSVNPAGNLVFDSKSTGSGPHELTFYPSKFNYFDCKNNKYELVFARKGSFVTNLSRANIPRPPSSGPKTRAPIINPGQPPNYIPPSMPASAPPGDLHETYPSQHSSINNVKQPVEYPGHYADYPSNIISDARLNITQAAVLNGGFEANLLPFPGEYYNFALTGANMNDIVSPVNGSNNGVWHLLYSCDAVSQYELGLELSFNSDQSLDVTRYNSSGTVLGTDNLSVGASTLLTIPVSTAGQCIRDNEQGYPTTGQADWNSNFRPEATGSNGDIRLKYYGYMPPGGSIPQGRVFWTVSRVHGTPPWSGW